MNHTAHCLLSYPDEALLLGNFIGDYVKGSAWKRYPLGVQRGILLHRAIDSFTDHHPATRASIARVREFAGRYAPPVVDILYDHLLCLQWDACCQVEFDVFANWVYASLDARSGEMPAELQARWPHMREGRFLQGYQTREGLEWVLGQFSRRLNGAVDAGALATHFFAGIADFASDFSAFFPDLQQRVLVFLKED
ncbi:MAG: DUF479 domain-containing protein [Saprospirales bacterium]|nr:DUF479 domain-containing protein [Saprospirales bacterium]